MFQAIAILKSWGKPNISVECTDNTFNKVQNRIKQMIRDNNKTFDPESFRIYTFDKDRNLLEYSFGKISNNRIYTKYTLTYK